MKHAKAQISRGSRGPIGGLLAAAALLAVGVPGGAALAWDAVGHRAITWLALDGLAADAPEFLRAPDTRDGIAWQSAEPDRWRGVNSAFLRHENAMDHFIDVEDLEVFGLTLETMSPLRYRFVRDMAIARHVHPTGQDEKHAPYNPRLDPAGDKEWCGFAPHEVAEQQAKLVSHFKTYRALVRLDEPSRAAQLAQTKANIAFTMGVMSHFVGDIAQPLHTTKHFNGWVGENPQGYTTGKGFHSWIDGGVLFQHGLDYHTLRAGQRFAATIDGRDPWAPTLAYVRRSHERVEPLYVLEKSGALEGEEGKRFIVECLHDGASMLAAYYNSAWQASVLSERDVEDFQRYDGFSPAQRPGADEGERAELGTPLAKLGEAPVAGRVLLVGTLVKLADAPAAGKERSRGARLEPSQMGELKLTDASVLLPTISLHRLPTVGARVVMMGRLSKLRSPGGAGSAEPGSGGAGWVLSVEDWRPEADGGRP